jgi:hypothetical protein
VYTLNRGVAVAEGKVFFGYTDNFLVALIKNRAAKFGESSARLPSSALRELCATRGLI